MFDEILACLDGSPLAEKILPLARGIAVAKGAKLTLLRVAEDTGDLSAQESYMRDRARLFGAEARFLISPDPASAVIGELETKRRAIAAMTTHGRTAWAEALLGSVALKVIQGARRPVLLFHPRPGISDPPAKITMLVIALDGSEFSEKIIPFAIETAKSITARVQLIQALPSSAQVPPVTGEAKSDVLESSYLHGKAAEIKRIYGIQPDWEVLHGEPGGAICSHVDGIQEAMLAMTARARGGLQRAFLGSVAAECIRNAGVPILIYWPDQKMP